MVETTFAGAISPKESEEEMQIEALKEAYEELKKCMAKNIISAVIHERDNTICIVILCR